MDFNALNSLSTGHLIQFVIEILADEQQKTIQINHKQSEKHEPSFVHLMVLANDSTLTNVKIRLNECGV